MRRNLKRKLNKTSLFTLIFLISIISYIIYLVFIYQYEMDSQGYLSINILSWLGICIGVYIIWSWYQLTGKIFTLYNIFMLFFFLFNYGQPLMWAIGIHQPDEIGQTSLYTLGRPTNDNIIYTQMLTLISIMMFHLGAVFCYKPRKNLVNNTHTKGIELTFTSIYYTCLILSFIVIPITFFNIISEFLYSQAHGYGALYYDENRPGNSLFTIIQYLFFPILVGLLVGSGYRKKVRYSVYVIFTIYLIINLSSGDRGSWIYSLILLIFMSHNFLKKINIRKTLLYSLFALLFLYLVNAIVLVRQSEDSLTLSNIIDSFALKNFPIINFIFEMGGSMQPALTLVQYGWDIWPYFNSYLMAIFGVISTKIFAVFNVPFDTLGHFFSQDYLGINYGAGFSIVAESLINYGPLFAPLFMILAGYVLSSLTFMDKTITLENNPFKIFFAVSTMSAFITITRGDLHFTLKSWFFGVLLLSVLIWLIRMIIKKKGIKKKSR